MPVRRARLGATLLQCSQLGAESNFVQHRALRSTHCPEFEFDPNRLARLPPKHPPPNSQGRSLPKQAKQRRVREYRSTGFAGLLVLPP